MITNIMLPASFFIDECEVPQIGLNMILADV